jgi:DNA-binding NarL/FixJ family response regulator
VESDTELATLETMARTDRQRAQAAISRVANLAFTLARPAEAEMVLDAATNTIRDEAAAQELAGMRSTLDAFLGRTTQAAQTAAGVLSHPRCSSAATHLAGWGLATACGGLGRLQQVDEHLARIDARPVPGLHQAAMVVALWLRGLVLGGLLDQADQLARHYRERCQDTPGPGDLVTNFMCGAVATSRGQVRTAVRWYRQALAASQGADPGGWSFGWLIFLTHSLGMAGDPTAARQALAEMTAAWHATYVYLEPETLLAQAWVTAAEGSLGEAITLARQAAELAASQQQSAVEVVALHTAVCFGDRTLAQRLAELATQVDGPRAPAAAAHAAALAAADAPGLNAASVQLEQIGALLLAADAAAQAAAVHTCQDRHGSAHTAATRAHRLARACEGARTPALAAIAAPLPLTQREREIVTLAASGLSNRQIAQRLVISVRTVENHLYHAWAKLGTTDRAELAALLYGQ